MARHSQAQPETAGHSRSQPILAPGMTARAKIDDSYTFSTDSNMRSSAKGPRPTPWTPKPKHEPTPEELSGKQTKQGKCKNRI